jgi:DNA-nicking Smr family endonuclease
MGKKAQPFNNPFRKARKSLEEKVRTPSKPNPAPVVEPPPPKPPTDDAEALFLNAMGDAKRVTSDPRGHARPTLPPDNAAHVQVHDEDAEALLELVSLIDGTAAFDIADTGEFIEGCVEGLDTRIMRKLRTGHYAVQGPHLDLHQFNRDDARVAVEKFLFDARARRLRCVLIVHGRGHNSKDNIPVLKNLLKVWMCRGRIGRHILAFCTARPHDGGAGAIYVLLRR